MQNVMCYNMGQLPLDMAMGKEHWIHGIPFSTTVPYLVEQRIEIDLVIHY